MLLALSLEYVLSEFSLSYLAGLCTRKICLELVKYLKFLNLVLTNGERLNANSK